MRTIIWLQGSDEKIANLRLKLFEKAECSVWIERNGFLKFLRLLRLFSFLCFGLCFYKRLSVAQVKAVAFRKYVNLDAAEREYVILFESGKVGVAHAARVNDRDRALT